MEALTVISRISFFLWSRCGKRSARINFYISCYYHGVVNVVSAGIKNYVHYALITTDNTFIFIPTLVSLHNKFSVSIRFADTTVISPSGISVESYMPFFPSGRPVFL